MPKDREIVFSLSADAMIRFERSSEHPVTYAIMLLVHRDGAWHTVRTFDNAHDVQEHHEHGYHGNTKQPPTITHGDVNTAMNNALVKLRTKWADIVAEWEVTR